MKLKSLFLFLLFINFVFPAQVPADRQEPPAVFRVEVGLVNIPVVVLGKNNKPLFGLDKIKFRVFEKKVAEAGSQERQIEQIELSQPEIKALRGGILIDTSGSTKRQFRYQRDAASEVVRWIIRLIANEERGDKFFVAEFYYEFLEEKPSSGIFAVKQDWTDQNKLLLSAIVKDTKKAIGGSPLFGSIRSAADKFASSDGQFSNFLIIISDGQNNLPFSNLKDSTYLAQAASLPIYTIGTASHLQTERTILAGFENNLKEISRLTGGRFFDLPSDDKWPSIADQILKDLKNRFHITYKLNPDYQNGNEIKIRIEAGEYDGSGRWKSLSNVRLLHRNGYRVVK